MLFLPLLPALPLKIEIYRRVQNPRYHERDIGRTAINASVAVRRNILWKQ